MTIQTLHGDCREMLQTLPDRSVQCVVTSPPYYGLRKYSDDPREIGQEATPALYVAALVEVFRQVRRVLRDDGIVWLNLGDSYGSGDWGANRGERASRRVVPGDRVNLNTGMAAKNLLGIPWRVAFALQEDGWILRSDIIWAKPNCMPESVTDRPTRAHEYVFLLAKNARYFYDADAIREPHARLWDAEKNGGSLCGTDNRDKAVIGGHGRAERAKSEPNPAGRNRRTVWTIATQPYGGAHYATMPEALIAPCILAGSSAQACEHCGAPWVRVVEREVIEKDKQTGRGWVDGIANQDNWESGTPTHSGLANSHYKRATTTGFAPSCACPGNHGRAASIVLDPFGGSGTVGKVALRYQRNAVLIELNAEYIEQHIESRTDGVQVELFV